MIFFIQLIYSKMVKRLDSVEVASSKRWRKQEDKRGRGSKMPKNAQETKQLQIADNDSDSKDLPIDICDEEF